MNICSLCHATVWRYFEHMPDEVDEDKKIWHVCIKLQGLCQVKGGLVTIIMNDKIECISQTIPNE